MCKASGVIHLHNCVVYLLAAFSEVRASTTESLEPVLYVHGAARSLSGHVFSIQADASNELQTHGQTVT